MADLEISDEWHEARGVIVNTLNQLNGAVNGNGKAGIITRFDKFEAAQAARDEALQDMQRRANNRLTIALTIIGLALTALLALAAFKH